MLENQGAHPVGHVAVSRRGVKLPRESTTEPVDVQFDGHWVWSFNPVRDATTGLSSAEVAWPEVLIPHLEGRSHVVLVTHTSKLVLLDDEVTFSRAEQRVSVVDEHGNRLAVDKSGRLQRKFDDTDDEVRGFIIETVEKILRDLREKAGLDAFLAFGCLLGAVRNGKMIGHDADADLAYLSKHTHPLDIIRENRAAVATMIALGYQLVQMSAADFKIWVPLPDGRRCGVDVFGGYYLNGDFYLLPTVHGTLKRSSLLPTSTIMLEGRELDAPAKPEDLLEVTYGSSWRVPDPSFKYEHPRSLSRHMDGYWRGARNQLRSWGTFYTGPKARRVPTQPSLFARWVNDYVDDTLDIVDVGSGTGRDAVWFARKGHHVVALDYVTQARKRIRRLAAKKQVDVEVSPLNLYDARSTLVAGARLAHDPKPRHVYARMLLDAISPAGRSEFYRFADMVTRRGGLTLVEFKAHGRATPTTVLREIAERGGTIEHQQLGHGLAPYGKRNPVMCRLVVRWNR
jgi:SAM-dependent methyltransferase